MTRRLLLVLFMLLAIPATGLADTISPSDPIKHVVIIYQENHSFDNVLGAWCVQQARCNGSTTAQVNNGTKTVTMPLLPATDVVPTVSHADSAQIGAMDGGKMDKFPSINGCHKAQGYLCLEQEQPSQIPNLIALAQNYAVSDATFEAHPTPSWGSHLDLVSASLDGFTGDNPVASTTGAPKGPGWGCNSNADADWMSPTNILMKVPACVPDYNLNTTTYPYGGAYRSSPVQWEPTIMDELDVAGLSWKIYEQTSTAQGIPYGWAICPTFADCLYTSQAQNMLTSTTIVQNAQKGKLPSVSFVMPNDPSSQHNGWSMTVGDNWIGKVMSALMNGPEWSSTAVFITYDDCGCFYDHVAPPNGDGPRLPMVLASPYARAGYTDSTPTTTMGMLAFIEHQFNLAPLGTADAGAYDYANSFSFGAAPQIAPRSALAPVAADARPTDRRPIMVQRRISKAEQEHLREDPPGPDDT